MEAYCVKCKAKREMLDAQEVEMKGKGDKVRLAMKGKCPECGTAMFRIMGNKKD
jgi:Zn finger protein HypA/HybF involved in hydrogenase expression